MKIVNVRQRSPEWHAWRSQGLSASEAPVIMGRSPHKTLWRLWAERRGIVRPPDLSRNPNVRRGIANEDNARSQFEATLGQAVQEDLEEADEETIVQARGDIEGVNNLFLLPACAESDDHPLMRASFDGLGDDGVPVEIKCPAPGTFEKVKLLREESEAYQVYWCQVQHQILVAGSAKGWLYFWSNGEAIPFEIQRDDAFLSALVARSMDFWAMLKSGKEPEKDLKRDIYIPEGTGLDAWNFLAVEYRLLYERLAGQRAKAKAIEAQLDGIEAKMVGLMGHYAQGEAMGIRVNRYVQKGAVDYKAALKAQNPDIQEADLDQFRRPDSDRVRVTLKGEDNADVPFSLEDIQVERDNDWVL